MPHPILLCIRFDLTSNAISTEATYPKRMPNSKVFCAFMCKVKATKANTNIIFFMFIDFEKGYKAINYIFREVFFQLALISFNNSTTSFSVLYGGVACEIFAENVILSTGSYKSRLP